MKLKEYMGNLNRVIAERPEALEFDVITSKDDEGNGFNRVVYSPTIGCYNEEKDDFGYTGRDSCTTICVN